MKKINPSINPSTRQSNTASINFTKMVASGNDFVILKHRPNGNLAKLTRAICDRKFGIGADGLLILEKSKVADIRMRILNADGSEAEMCGNGIRCAAVYTGKSCKTIETKAGIIATEVSACNVRIKLTDPKNIKLDMPLQVNNRKLRVNFINTGVPHVVIFTEGLDKIRINDIARNIRYHKIFSPAGTNVNFIEILSRNAFKIRTFERGVEDETLACGTGAAAAALIFSLKTQYLGKVYVYTASKEVLRVYFEKTNNQFRNVWLEGKTKIVYQGVYYV